MSGWVGVLVEVGFIFGFDEFVFKGYGVVDFFSRLGVGFGNWDYVYEFDGVVGV